MVSASLLEEVVQDTGARQGAYLSIGLQEAARNMMKAGNMQFTVKVREEFIQF